MKRDSNGCPFFCSFLECRIIAAAAGGFFLRYRTEVEHFWKVQKGICADARRWLPPASSWVLGWCKEYQIVTKADQPLHF